MPTTNSTQLPIRPKATRGAGFSLRAGFIRLLGPSTKEITQKLGEAVERKPTYQSPRFPAKTRQGGALLAVLWLSVALSTIALTVASTVRGEVDRAATASDDTRAYFIAQSAINRTILYIQWGRTYGPGTYYQPGTPPLHQNPRHPPAAQRRARVLPTRPH